MQHLLRCGRFCLLLLPVAQVRAQTSGSVGIGTTAPHASAALEVSAANKGLLAPRLTAAQRTAISSPATGLLVYQTDGSPGFYYFDGQRWLDQSTGAAPDATGRLPRAYNHVSTLAGNGSAGSANGPVLTAQFNRPQLLAVDGQGRVYISDENSHRIRVIENGQVRILAGDGTAGYRDGPAASAQFNNPQGLAADAQGRVYVADTDNHRIRVIENGQVSTLTGTGTAGHGDGPAATAQLTLPLDVALDPQGRVYVSERAGVSSHRIRLIDNGQVSTLATNIVSMGGMAVDGQGRVYYAGRGRYQIYFLDNGVERLLAGYRITPVALDGPAAQATFSFPMDVAVDGQGRVYVAELGFDRIRVIENGLVSTLAGGADMYPVSGYADGPAASARFQNPRALALDAQGAVYVADADNYRIRRIGPATTAPQLYLSGNVLGVTGGNAVLLPTEQQTLSLSGQTLSISGGNAVTLPSPTLSLSGQDLSIAGGNTVSLPAERQTLSVSGQGLSIAGGNTVTVPGDNLGDHTATGPLKYSTNDADKLWFTQAYGANGPKLEHAGGWLLNYYAGPNNQASGVHRFLTGTPTGWLERLRITDHGNVGIGTSTPSQRLDVAGNVQIGGDAQVDGAVRQRSYVQGLVALAAGAATTFTWPHGLGYQPTLMVSLDQTGGQNADFVSVSYQHDSASEVRFFLRNRGTSRATFRVRWIRVD